MKCKVILAKKSKDGIVRTAPAKSAHELMSGFKNLNITPIKIGFYKSYIWTILLALHFINT